MRGREINVLPRSGLNSPLYGVSGFRCHRCAREIRENCTEKLPFCKDSAIIETIVGRFRRLADHSISFIPLIGVGNAHGVYLVHLRLNIQTPCIFRTLHTRIHTHATPRANL